RSDQFVVDIANLAAAQDPSLFKITSSGFGDDISTDQLIIFLVEFKPVYLVPFKEHGIARIGNFYLLHHGADDRLNMLVVDPHSLQAIYLLDLIHKIRLYSIGTHNIEDLLGGNRTVGKLLAGFYIVVLLDKNMLRQRDQICFLRLAVLAFNNDFLFTAFTPAHAHDTVNFRYGGRVAGGTGLKEFRHARQTCRNIF